MSKFTTVPYRGTPEQESALREVIAKLKGEPGSLMPILQHAQSIFGYLPEEAMQIISDETGHTMSEIYGVATFYSQFALSPKGKYEISICLGTACYVKGSQEVFDAFSKALGINGGECTPDAKFSLTATRCIGCCGLAPVGTVNDEVYGKMTAKDVPAIMAKYNAME